MPVVLVNPSSRRRRTNPRRRRRTTRRRTRRYARVRGYTRRLPNPTTSWKGAFGCAGLGGLGGLLAGGLEWGADYLPWPAWGQALSLFGAGALTSVALCKLADTRVGAGVAGGTTAILVGRVRQLVALAALDNGNGNGNGNGDASAVIRRGAGAVYDAAQMRRQQTPYSMKTSSFPGARTFKVPEAGASYYLGGPQRRYGPHSWIYQRGAGAVYVSAHNAR
ncbi:MAG: hypothetical protein ACYSU7_06935 [Planctomycetota bacterium]|jgi:hypothetical protein